MEVFFSFVLFFPPALTTAFRPAMSRELQDPPAAEVSAADAFNPLYRWPQVWVPVWWA